MALRQRLTKEEHGKLSADLQAHYVADGDGFRLDVEDPQPPPGPDKDAQIRTLQQELEAAKKAKPPANETAAIQELRGELEKERRSRREERFGRVVGEAVSKAGFLPGASQDVVGRVRAAGLELQEDGSVAAVTEGAAPVSLDSFLTQLRKDAPHLYQPPRAVVEGGKPGQLQKEPEKILSNPSDAEFLANLEDISSGKTRVERSDH